MRIEGKVVSVTPRGNLVTDIPRERLDRAPRDESVTIRCDEHATTGLFTADHRQSAMTLIALLGPSGCLELEIVDDSANAMLGVAIGERVTVEW